MPRPPRILLAGRSVSSAQFQAAYSTVVSIPLESALPSISQHEADVDAKLSTPERNLLDNQPSPLRVCNWLGSLSSFLISTLFQDEPTARVSIHETTRIGTRLKAKADRMDAAAMINPVKT